MSSIYRQALGSDFERLHPRIQQRFGFDSAAGIAAVGTGVMDRIWRGAAFTLPFLSFGAWRHIMFPYSGRDVPFTIQNYAYRDRFGRETVTWVRTFDFNGRPRRFDATMIYSRQRGRIVDYLGTHQHLAVDIDLRVGPNGGLCLRSGEQRFYEGFVGFRFPPACSGIAEVCEWYDDETERFRIEVNVANPRWGPLFGYRGWFNNQILACNQGAVPREIQPLRQERRE